MLSKSTYSRYEYLLFLTVLTKPRIVIIPIHHDATLRRLKTHFLTRPSDTHAVRNCPQYFGIRFSENYLEGNQSPKSNLRHQLMGTGCTPCKFTLDAHGAKPITPSFGQFKPPTMELKSTFLITKLFDYHASLELI